MELTAVGAETIRYCVVPGCRRRLSVLYNSGDRCFRHDKETEITAEEETEKRFQEIETALEERRIPESFLTNPEDVAFSLILGIVSYVYGVNQKDILGFFRNQQVARARRVVIFFLCEELNRSFPRIAKDLKRNDDGPARQSQKIIEREISSNEETRQEIQRMRAVFKGFLEIAVKV